MKTLILALVASCTTVGFAAEKSAIDAAVAKGMKFLLAQQQPDGHFSESNTPALTALPLWAMSVTGEGKGKSEKVKSAEGKSPAEMAAAFVLACQQPDGGFYAKMPPRPPMGDRKGPPPKGVRKGPPPEKPNGSGGPGGYRLTIRRCAWRRCMSPALRRPRRF